MATDELAAAPAGGDPSAAFSFSIWPPTQRTRDAVVRRLVETLTTDTILCKRYGAVPGADADPAARAIEAEAFDAAAATGGAAASATSLSPAPRVPRPRRLRRRRPPPRSRARWRERRAAIAFFLFLFSWEKLHQELVSRLCLRLWSGLYDLMLDVCTSMQFLFFDE